MLSESDRLVGRLIDIVDNIDAAQEFVTGKTYDEFLESRMTSYAVLKALEIISEASRHIPEDVKMRHREISWSKIKASGNIYRHEYKGVDLDVVWETVQHHLTPLRDAAVEEIVRLGRGDLLSGK